MVVHYEALGPVQFMRVVHIFFPFNGSYVPLGGSSRINVQAGTIKTSFEIAMWPFQSSSNSLLLTLTAKTNSPITELRRSAASINNETEFAIKTESLTLNFGVLNLAVYDSLTTVRSISFNASTIESGVAFKFLFSSFDTWMGYDPQLSVVLGGTGSGGDGSSNTALIVGLSVGLGGAAVVAVFLIVGIAFLVSVTAKFWRPIATNKIVTFDGSNTETVLFCNTGTLKNTILNAKTPGIRIKHFTEFEMKGAR